MSTTIIRAAGNLDGALQETAKSIFATLKAQGSETPLTVGLCGGRSVVGLLSALEKESANQPKDILKRIQFFMVDERLVPVTDEQSNYGGLKKLLFDSLVERGAISESQLHPFVCDTTLADFGCARYAEELRGVGGRFTVVVLGVGEDGHVAGLFPHHRSLSVPGLSFIHFHDSPKPPADRMTASVGLIEGADLSIVLALGEAKRAAWESFKAAGTSVADCPAIMATRAASCVVVTDLEVAV